MSIGGDGWGLAADLSMFFLGGGSGTGWRCTRLGLQTQEVRQHQVLLSQQASLIISTAALSTTQQLKELCETEKETEKARVN